MEFDLYFYPNLTLCWQTNSTDKKIHIKIFFIISSKQTSTPLPFEFFSKKIKLSPSSYNLVPLPRKKTGKSVIYFQKIINIKNLKMSVHNNSKVKKITTRVLQNMKNEGIKISMLTAYDYSTASLLDKAGIDVILVGDSAANVMAGFETTLPMTLDAMIYHASSVVRAVNRAMVVVDLPFGTYQGNSKKALFSAIRIMKETGANAIKIEGGKEVAESVSRILTAGIPVMGHLGLTPQSINKFGTYAVRATSESEAQKLISDALHLEATGLFGLVLEKIPAKLGRDIAKKLSIPVIGIGAGKHVDGQVLVIHDMLGITQEFSPRFLRRYHNLSDEIQNSVKQYIKDVKDGDFPNEKEQY